MTAYVCFNALLKQGVHTVHQVMEVGLNASVEEAPQHFRFSL